MDCDVQTVLGVSSAAGNASVQAALLDVLAGRCNLKAGRAKVIALLREHGIPEREMPSSSAFNRAIKNLRLKFARRASAYGKAGKV